MGIHNLSTLGETSQLKLESTQKKSNRTSIMMKTIILLAIVAIVLASSAPMQDTIEERSGTTCKRNCQQPMFAMNCGECAKYSKDQRMKKNKHCDLCCCSDSIAFCFTCHAYTPAEVVIGK